METSSVEQRLDEHERRMDNFAFDLRELRRQAPNKFAPLIYAACAVGAIWLCKVGMDQGVYWLSVVAMMMFAGYMLKAAQTWQDLGEYKARGSCG
jgi:hypothetical protein